MEQYQKQRFELKYLIPLTLVEPIRDYVSSYLEMDYHSARFPDFAYPIHSLYLDSEDMKLYQNTINGDRNRYKLRVRYYEQNGKSPLFFEVKTRRDAVIQKHRAMVRRSAMRELLNGRFPAEEDLHEREETQWAALAHFCNLMRTLNASPKAHVGYRREAWKAPNNSVRVTLDRDVRTAPDIEASLNTDLEGLKPVFGNGIVLEIKFTDRFPLWLNQMVCAFNLRRGSAAKYVDGVVMLGEYRFLSAHGRNEIRRRTSLRRSGAIGRVQGYGSIR